MLMYLNIHGIAKVAQGQSRAFCGRTGTVYNVLNILFITAVSIATIVVSSCISYGETIEETVLKEMKNNTFILAIHDPEKTNNIELIGTVFSISSYYFLSVQHSLNKWDGEDQLIAINPNTGNEIYLKIIKQKSERDLAIFKGNVKRRNFLRMKESPVNIGERILIYGYPEENVKSINNYKGTLLETLIKDFGNLREVRALGTVIIFDKVLQGNHSGSPIVDKTGSLIGVAKAEIIDVPKYSGHSLGIYINPQDDFIVKYLDKSK